MPLTSRLRGAAASIFGSIRSAAARGASVFGLSTRITQAYQDLQLPPQITSIDELSTAYSLAGSLDAAQRALSAAPDDAAITSDMIGTGMWSMSLQQFNTRPQYRADIEMTITADDGSTYTAWRSIIGIRYLPGMGKSGLMSILRLNAQQFMRGANSPPGLEGTLSGIGNVTLSVDSARA